MKIFPLTIVWLTILTRYSFAGDSATTKFSAVIEPYYVWRNNNAGSKLPSILGNYRNTDQFNVNMVLLNADYSSEKVRASAGLVAGTYAEANLSAENDILRHIFQAYGGFTIYRNLWIEAGVFPSPIGFESANPVNNWTLTRSMLAENSPYYCTGIRSIYTINKLTFAAYVINGWQTISETDRNKALCLQATFNSRKSTFNFSTYSGKVLQNITSGNMNVETNSWRNFINFYWIQKVNKDFQFTAGWDLGLQQQAFSTQQNVWTTACVITKEKLSSRFESAQRIEFFSDNEQVISSLDLKKKPLFSSSVNIDYLPANNVRVRIEPRLLWSERPLFRNKNNFVGDEFFISSSIILSL